jgi:hypothetical protein
MMLWDVESPTEEMMRMGCGESYRGNDEAKFHAKSRSSFVPGSI